MNSVLFQFLPLLISPVSIFIVIAYYQDFKRNKKYIASGFKFILWFIIFTVFYFGIATILNITIITSILAFGVLVPMILILKSIVIKNGHS
ncbi:hypothetical protein A9Q93_02355 [Nonlabens dokdonensis]|uniref:Uncharacterized protein n=1 Tax=Nonlabens dokdonensis TaxID=328515 RepID=A0A1Z8B9M6_9FLAO|nr:hypothetical protein A9Q93_02355 [Nonlabens dokdonensis]